MTVYREFVWSEGMELIFETKQRLTDGPLGLHIQIFGPEGCLEGSAHLNCTLSTDMGLEDPPCPECLFTTGWASAHFTQWETFLLSGLHPALPPHPDILEIGSWEGMSAIWLSHHLAARSITCVDTWQGGPDQHGAFADAVLPGTIRQRHLPC